MNLCLKSHVSVSSLVSYFCGIVMRKGSDFLGYQSGGKKRGGGISALDLAKLPRNQRKIVRVLLRGVQMTYSDLCRAVEEMPEADRMRRAELDEALEALNEQGWLKRVSDQHITTYRVNLGRKAGSRLNKDIWAALDPKIKKNRNDE